MDDETIARYLAPVNADTSLTNDAKAMIAYHVKAFAQYANDMKKPDPKPVLPDVEPLPSDTHAWDRDANASYK